MSISQNFPEEGPTLNLNFAGSRTLDPRITFTRTSSATYMGRDGLVKIAPANSARFDHRYNSTTGEIESLGLLVEEGRTNLLTYSEDFDNLFKNGTQVTQNNILSPSNQSTADLIEVITSGGSKSVARNALTTIGSTYTLSVFAKSANSTTFSMGLFTNAFIGLYNFNLTGSGSIITQLAGISASIIPYPNGWYRCSLTATTNGSATTTLIYPNTTVNSIGDSIYLWGAQVEQGSFPTSYIPTTATTVTRTADNVRITGSNFSDFYNPNEGSIFLQALTNDPTDGSGFLTIEDGSVSEYIRMSRGFFRSEFLVNKQGGVQAQVYSLENITTGNMFKVCSTYKLNDVAMSLNSRTPITDTTVNLPSPATFLRIGLGKYLRQINGTISQLIYYSSRLPNDQLIALTK